MEEKLSVSYSINTEFSRENADEGYVNVKVVDPGEKLLVKDQKYQYVGYVKSNRVMRINLGVNSIGTGFGLLNFKQSYRTLTQKQLNRVITAKSKFFIHDKKQKIYTEPNLSLYIVCLKNPQENSIPTVNYKPYNDNFKPNVDCDSYGLTKINIQKLPFKYILQKWYDEDLEIMKANKQMYEENNHECRNCGGRIQPIPSKIEGTGGQHIMSCQNPDCTHHLPREAIDLYELVEIQFGKK